MRNLKLFASGSTEEKDRYEENGEYKNVNVSSLHHMQEITSNGFSFSVLAFSAGIREREGFGGGKLIKFSRVKVKKAQCH